MVIISISSRATYCAFRELERAIPAASQKNLLIEQLRELERDGVVNRTVYPAGAAQGQYRLTRVGKGGVPRH